MSHVTDTVNGDGRMSLTSARAANFFDVDRRRRDRGLSIEALCKAAGVSVRTWWRIKARPAAAEERTLRRLEAALGAVHQEAAPAIDAVRSLIQATLALLAATAGLDPERQVLRQDFTVQKPLDRDWLAASHLRRAAMWLVLMHVDGVERKDIAAACGCSRQNVAQAIQFVEERTEAEPAFASLLDRVGTLINGGKP